MDTIEGKQLVGMICHAADRISENRDYLCKLDSFVGDGDHGVTVARGFSSVKAELSGLENKSVEEILETVGDTLSSTMGGAIGPIFGAIFSGMAEEASDHIGTKELTLMLESGLDTVMAVGGAAVGDRTLVDALSPAVDSLVADSKRDVPLFEALVHAAEAAEQGAEATKDMVAKKGRAKFLQEKSKGYRDAGASSMQIVLAAFAEYCSEN